jgi:hypothetical protein
VFRKQYVKILLFGLIALISSVSLFLRAKKSKMRSSVNPELSFQIKELEAVESPPHQDCPKSIDEPLQESLQSYRKQVLQQNTERGLNLIRELLMRKPPQRSFTSYADEIINCLQENEKYAELCKTLQEIKTCKSLYTIGSRIKKYLNILPKDVQEYYNAMSFRALYQHTKALISYRPPA